MPDKITGQPYPIELTITPPGKDQMPAPEAYAAREQQSIDQKYQQLLSPEGAQTEGAPKPEGGAPPEKPSIALEGLKAGWASANESARQVFEGLTEMATLGLKPGSPAPPETLKKIIMGVLSFVPGSIAAGAGAAAQTAVKNEAPDMEAMPALDARLSGLIRGLVSGQEIERQPKEMTVGELVNIATQVGLPAAAMGLPKAVGAAKEQYAKLPEQTRTALAGERGAVGSKPKVAGEPNVNTERVNTTDRVKTVMKNISSGNAERLAQDRKTVSHQQIIAESRGALSLEEALALDESAAIDKAKMTALRDHYVASAEHLDRLTEQVLSGDQNVIQEFWDTAAVAIELAAKDETIGRVGARALEARKILSDARRARFNPDQIVGLAQTLATAPDMDPVTFALKLRGLNKTQKQKFLGSIAAGFKTGQNALYEYWINSLLSNPVTHVANITSNALMTAVAMEERVVAGGIRQAKRLFGADGPGVEVGEGMAQLMALQQAFRDGMKLMVESWKMEDSAFGGEKFERAKAISAEQWGIPKGGNGFGEAIDYLGTAVRLPTRALLAEDAFYKGVNYRLELAAQAFREATQEGLTKGADAFKERVKYIYDHPEDFPSIDASAKQQALVNTFNNELGVGGSLLSQALDRIPLARLILPFQRTPTNIWKQTYYRLPILGQLTWNFVQEVSAGGARADLAQARLATAGFVGGSLLALVYAGKITGAKPKEATAAKAWDAQGKQEYAVLIDNEWVKYTRGTEPLGTLLGVMADYGQIAGQLPGMSELHGPEIPERLRILASHPGELALATKLALTNLMIKQSYFEGVDQALRALMDEERPAKNLLRQYLQSAVPYSGLVRNLRRNGIFGIGADDVRRDTAALTEVGEAIRAIQDVLPMWSKSLPPLRNHITGEIEVYNPGIGPDNFSPFASSTHMPDALMKEIEDNHVNLPKPSRWIGGSKPAASMFEMREEKPGAGVYLSGREYSQLIDMMHSVKMNGRTLLESLDRVIQSPQYQRLSPGEGGSRADRIEAEYRAYKQKAINEFLKQPENEELKVQVKEHVERRINAKRPITSPKSPHFENLIDSVGR